MEKDREKIAKLQRIASVAVLTLATPVFVTLWASGAYPPWAALLMLVVSGLLARFLWRRSLDQPAEWIVRHVDAGVESHERDLIDGASLVSAAMLLALVVFELVAIFAR